MEKSEPAARWRD